MEDLKKSYNSRARETLFLSHVFYSSLRNYFV